MPTEAEVQTQWKNLVNVLEKSRAYFDDDLVDPGGYIDVFVQSLEGEYLSISGPSVVSRIRALCSSAVDASRVLPNGQHQHGAGSFSVNCECGCIQYPNQRLKVCRALQRTLSST